MYRPDSLIHPRLATCRFALAALLVMCGISQADAAECAASATPIIVPIANPIAAYAYSSTGEITVVCMNVTTPLTLNLSMQPAESAFDHFRMRRAAGISAEALEYTISFTPPGSGYGQTTYTSTVLPSSAPVRLRIPFFVRIMGHQLVAPGQYNDKPALMIDY